MAMEENIETKGLLPSSEEEKPRCIDTYMLSSKITYFLNNGKYSINEFFVLFFVSTGLNAEKAGYVNGILTLGGTIAAPLWGFLADHKHCHHSIMILLCLASLLTMNSQFILSEIFGNNCKTECAHIEHSNLLRNDTFNSPSCWRYTLGGSYDNPLFISLLVSSTITSVFDGTLLSFVQSGVLQRVNNAPTSIDFGHQRLFGSLGYGVIAMVYSGAIQYFPEGDVSCYCGLFIVYSAMNLGLLISSHVLYKDLEITQEKKEGTFKESLHLLGSTFMRFESLVVFFAIFINGLFRGTWYSFLFIYLKDLNGPTLLLGWSLLITAASGATIFFFSKRILAILQGPLGAMVFTAFVWSVRFISLALLTNPYYVVFIDIIHGITKPLFIVAMLIYINEISDRLILTTMCSIGNTLNNLGLMTASFIGGLLYERYGGRRLFQCAAFFSAGWGVVLFLYIACKAMCIRKYESNNK